MELPADPPTCLADLEQSASPTAPSTDAAPPLTKREIGWELLAVSAVGLVRWIWDSFQLLLTPRPQEPYWVGAVHWTVHSASISFVVLYIVSRNGTPLKRFGIVRPGLADLGLALVVLFYTWLIVVALRPITLGSEGAVSEYLFTGSYDLLAIVILNLSAAFVEELIARAYLITRLEALLDSTLSAMVLSALVCGAYHVYQGPEYLPFHVAKGFVDAVLFVLVRRLWPLVLGHAAYNISIEYW